MSCNKSKKSCANKKAEQTSVFRGLLSELMCMEFVPVACTNGHHNSVGCAAAQFPKVEWCLFCRIEKALGE